MDGRYQVHYLPCFAVDNHVVLFGDQDRVHVLPMHDISLLHRPFGIESVPDPFNLPPES